MVDPLSLQRISFFHDLTSPRLPRKQIFFLFFSINKIIHKIRPYEDAEEIGIPFPPKHLPNYLDVAAWVVIAQPQLRIARKYLYLLRSRRVIIFLASDSGCEKTNTS